MLVEIIKSSTNTKSPKAGDQCDITYAGTLKDGSNSSANDGNAFIDNFSIALDQSKIRRKIGYCPQFDALLELLTVREHLELYGRLKGLQGQALEEVVMKKMEQLDLLDFENKTAGCRYSS